MSVFIGQSFLNVGGSFHNYSVSPHLLKIRDFVFYEDYFLLKLPAINCGGSPTFKEYVCFVFARHRKPACAVTLRQEAGNTLAVKFNVLDLCHYKTTYLVIRLSYRGFGSHFYLIARKIINN